MSTAYRLRLQCIDARGPRDFDVIFSDLHSSNQLFQTSSLWILRRAQLPKNATIAKPGRQILYKAFTIALARDPWLWEHPMCSVTSNLSDCARSGIIIEHTSVGSPPIIKRVLHPQPRRCRTVYSNLRYHFAHYVLYFRALSVSYSCGRFLAPMTFPPDQCDDQQMNGRMSLTLHALR